MAVMNVSALTDSVDKANTRKILSSGITPGGAKLMSWQNAAIRSVAPDRERHSIHAYFNTCPESPDGRWVLYFTSGEADAHHGDLRILERASGREIVIARNIEVEDAHRTACQQWLAGGRYVTFHDLREGRWLVIAVDIETQEQRVLATDRMVGWGQPGGDEIPLYGLHWNAAALRDLEILNVHTGKTRTELTAAAVRAKYPQVVEECGEESSIFFPILSPDGRRVFFKLATPAGGDFRSWRASKRQWLIAYDLAEAKFLFIHKLWGHPAWHPDSRHIVNMQNLLMSSDDGSVRAIPELPIFPGSHPSVSPDGQLLLTDTRMEDFGGDPDSLGVAVAKMSGKDYVIVHTFDNSHGATSWRPPHPHPVFSADGRRIYFNAGSTRWTHLCVAERADRKSSVPRAESTLERRAL
jgi:hypothetical protein